VSRVFEQCSSHVNQPEPTPADSDRLNGAFAVNPSETLPIVRRSWRRDRDRQEADQSRRDTVLTYATPQPYQPYPPPQIPGNSGMATASLVLGLVGLFFSWFTFGIPSMLAVIFGHIGISQTRPDRGLSGRGMAIAGLVLGYVVVAFAIYVSIAVVYGIGQVASTVPD
jgi:Domain of unknown function (DUF4190)